MSPDLFAALTFLLGLVLGLWWGERGRRLAAERWKVYGTPEEPGAAVVTSPAEPAARAAAEFSGTAIERGAADLEAMMSPEGFNHTKAEYREMARSMLLEANRR